MANFLLSFEISPHSEVENFVAAARRRGWAPWIASTKGIKYMVPERSLVGDFPGILEAEESLKASAAAARRNAEDDMELIKFVIVQFDVSRFSSDRRRHPTVKADAATAQE
ncbi:hypothetical protein KHC28_00085 [Ancylobacter sonchi]|uniref:hypothetical protein n=1 Tax=Ancylobacter sonchi TaxID=1937790 RepID=UPI001BD55BCC|nr:hypothetical protein [Ancylobacter sonchi]MBS7532063.1 hypothetical protein [Ancylobacter sonchi]